MGLVRKNAFIFCTALSISIIVSFLSGCGKEEQKVENHKIGILCGHAAFVDIAEGLKAKLTEMGYIEGENIIYDMQEAYSGIDEIDQVVKSFIAKKVDLIFSFTTEASLRAKELTRGTNIPVVFAMSGIEGNNLVDSVYRPGGNTTGVRYAGPEQVKKKFELFRELVPEAKYIWAAYNKDYPTIKVALEVLRPAVKAAGMILDEAMVTTTEEIQKDLDAHVVSGDPDIDVIFMMPEDVTQSPDGWAVINNYAAKYNIPIVGGAAVQVYNGALFTYVSDNKAIGSQAALMVDKILKGTPAGTIMVATPYLYLRLNYKLAQEIGISVPEGFLSRVDEIIR